MNCFAAAMRRFKLSARNHESLRYCILGATLSALTKSDVNWPHNGGDAGGMRYSRLTQFNPQTVSQLKTAWVSCASRWQAIKREDLSTDQYRYKRTFVNKFLSLGYALQTFRRFKRSLCRPSDGERKPHRDGKQEGVQDAEEKKSRGECA